MTAQKAVERVSNQNECRIDSMNEKKKGMPTSNRRQQTEKNTNGTSTKNK